MPKRCACTGVRWCAACRDPGLRAQHGMRPPLAPPACDPSVDFDLDRQSAPGLPHFAGLRVIEDFVSEPEAHALLREIEAQPFVHSQSGKRKQHFGPKMNFRKQRMNASGFTGIPAWARRIEERLREHAHALALADALARYQTTDVFVLRYRPEDRSNLDLHTDDLFAYGEVILDLSLESDCVLTFHQPATGACVRAPLPARSLAVLFGPARFDWEHGILADDVSHQRTSITLRTLGDEPRRSEAGRRVLEAAR